MKNILKLLQKHKKFTLNDMPAEVILNVMTFLIEEPKDNNLSGYLDLYRISKVNKKLNMLAYDERLDHEYKPNTLHIFGLKKVVQNAKTTFFAKYQPNVGINRFVYLLSRTPKKRCEYSEDKGKYLSSYEAIKEFLHSDGFNTLNAIPALHMVVQNYENKLKNFHKSNDKKEQKKYKKQMKRLLDILGLLLERGADLNKPYQKANSYGNDFPEGITVLEMVRKIQNIYQDNQLANFLEKYISKCSKRFNPLQH